MQIAIYGKGGIGKSTISANISAALAMSGKKILQIGCDPKHDSTRLLMHGRDILPALDYLKETDALLAEPSEILKTGAFGVGCIEAGGPKPGVGCAGRGIITAFEFLKKHRVLQNFDHVIYDVLGDVVCGGFAVPVRREYADAVFLVTSGEFMSIYAANNILRGIRNFDSDAYKRVAGIIYNARNIPKEDIRVERFAAAAGLPVCAKIPRSIAFAEAERQKCVVMELSGDIAEKKIFNKLAAMISKNMELFLAHPLEDKQLESVVLADVPGNIAHKPGADCTGNGTFAKNSAACISSCGDSSFCHTEKKPGAEDITKETRPQEATGTGEDPHSRPPSKTRPPLYGCAFNGAATTAINITDAIVIAHSPRACAFYTWQNISSTGRRNLFNRGVLLPSSLCPHFECTNMDSSDVIFGGEQKLVNATRAAIAKSPECVIIVSSCVSGIIGDDITKALALSTPKTPVFFIAADGDINGSYMDGINMCMHTLSEGLFDTAVKPSGKRVNLINEMTTMSTTAENFKTVEDLLKRLGVSINCRFLGNATTAQLKNFLAAPLNLPATDSQDTRDLQKYLETKYGCEFFDMALPIGFAASEKWLCGISAYFGCGSRHVDIINDERKKYLEKIRELKIVLSGKKVLITTINISLDWLIDACGDAGIRLVWVGVLNYLGLEMRITARKNPAFKIQEGYSWDDLRENINVHDPDIVICNYTQQAEGMGRIVDTLPTAPVAGFSSAIPVLSRWAELLRFGTRGDWRNDSSFFEKYFA